VVAFAVLAFERRGYRHFELMIGGLLGIVSLGFCYDLAVVGADPGRAVAGLVPAPQGRAVC
jgi:manganese transport protein